MLELTGSQALRPAEQVAVLAAVLNRPLVAHELGDDETEAELAATMPREYVDAFPSFFVEGRLDEADALSDRRAGDRPIAAHFRAGGEHPRLGVRGDAELSGRIRPTG
ncbi:hypothetical protein IU450_15825 [Nocardia abscessus]|uniref:hypothetical protein n=1 Tax=Nocardia abscessus TaxID=120957 RepID=UPI0018961917|nr:hypothetical protein [Nocardia abscessus]MBF6337353.1 hypothetical protein [Nocardia abscessus]